MQALVAPAKRDKLLHAIFGMFRHWLPFDGGKGYHLPQAVAANSASCRKEVVKQEKAPTPPIQTFYLHCKRESTRSAAGIPECLPLQT